MTVHRTGVMPAMPRTFTDAEREQFLADKHVAALSIATADGRPPALTPMWYLYEPGGNIVINTAADRRKARLLHDADTVSLLVQREDEPRQYVVVEGTVIDTTTPTPAAVREAIARRYIGEDAAAGFVQSLDITDTVMFTIRPDRWITYSSQ
jgi:uncharacterized protein